MRINPQITLLFTFVLSFFLVKAQEENQIKAIAHSYPDSVVIKWAPTNAPLWLNLNKTGYSVVRYTIVKNGKVLSEPIEKILTPQGNLKPLELDNWEKLTQQSKYAAIAAQALYGEDFEIRNASKNKIKNQSILSLAEKANELELKYTFALMAAELDQPTASALGLRIVDHEVLKGEKYFYRIIPQTSLKCDTGLVYISCCQTQVLPKPKGLSALFSDSSVVLSWQSKEIEQHYIAYWIERSDDGGKQFKKVNQEPFLSLFKGKEQPPFIFYTDTLKNRTKKYVYRVQGLTSFGEVSPFSDTIQGKCISTFDLFPERLEFNDLDTKLYISWQIKDMFKHDVKGFHILYSSKYEGVYKKLNSQLIAEQQRNYELPKPYKSGYYKVQVIDKREKTNVSFPYMYQINDSIPPEPAYNLSAKIDSIGQVLLKWDYKKETDLRGFYVYKANFRKNEFSRETNRYITENSFADSIEVHNLVDSVFYYIISIDNRYNESKPSKILALARPDLVAPTSPVFKSVLPDEKGIKLSWYASSSDDVKRYELYRTDEEGNRLKRFETKDVSKAIGEFYDTLLVERHTYRYEIFAIDKSGLVSKTSTPIESQKLVSSSKLQLENFVGSYDTKNNTVSLRWGYSKNDPSTRFILYRASEGELMGQYENIKFGTYTFEDKEIKSGKTYTYLIKIVDAKNNVGWSTKISVPTTE